MRFFRKVEIGRPSRAFPLKERSERLSTHTAQASQTRYLDRVDAGQPASAGLPCTIHTGCHRTIWLAGAPARPKSAVICFPTLRWLDPFSRDETPGLEVSTLSGRAKFEPLSLSLQEGLRFFTPSFTRRPMGVPYGSLALLSEEPTSLPRSVTVPGCWGLGSASPPGVHHLRQVS